MSNKTMIVLIVMMLPLSIHAYIGPGMGAGALASVIGVVSALALAIIAILYYPIKRFIRKRKSGGKTLEEVKTDDSK